MVKTTAMLLLPCAASSSLGRGMSPQTLPHQDLNFELTTIMFPLPVQNLCSSLITSLHQDYLWHHLHTPVKLVWGNAAHQPVKCMTAPHLEDLGLAGAWKSKVFTWLSLLTTTSTDLHILISDKNRTFKPEGEGKKSSCFSLTSQLDVFRLPWGSQRALLKRILQKVLLKRPCSHQGLGNLVLLPCSWRQKLLPKCGWTH